MNVLNQLIPELLKAIEASVEKGVAKAITEYAPPVPSPPNKLLTIQEVADLLQVSVSSVNTYKRQGSIPFYRMGRRIFFKEADVLESLKKINK